MQTLRCHYIPLIFKTWDPWMLFHLATASMALGGGTVVDFRP